MRTLTPEEEKFLVNYCMESKENTWLALAIGQIQTKIWAKILSSVLCQLDKSVKERLKKVDDLNWEPMIPKLNLAWDDKIYQMTMKDRDIEIDLYHSGRGLFVPRDLFLGTPAEFKDCPQADDLTEFFKGTNLKLESNPGWRWWFYLEGEHRSLEELSILHEDQELKREKIAYLTDILVSSAKAISKYWRQEGDQRHETKTGGPRLL